MTKLKIFALAPMLIALVIPGVSLGATKKDVCTLPDNTASICINRDTLVTKKENPTITGRAEDVKSLRLFVRKDGEVIWKSRIVKVRKSGTWSIPIKEKLKDGTYDISIYEKADLKDALAQETLLIGTQKAGAGTLEASPIPLLFGGEAKRGSKAPVAYVKLINRGKATTSIEGFTLAQNGSASAKAVAAFETADDKGGSRTTVKNEDGELFSGKNVFVPLKATLAPGQMRIFTLLALVTSDASVGSTLKFDVAGVKSSASIGGKFPMKGTTWTIR